MQTKRLRKRRMMRLGTRGVAAVELAVILPVMILMVAGIVEIGRIFQVYDATNRLATQYALSWSDCSDNSSAVCQTELNTYVSAASIANVVPQLTLANLTLTMVEYTLISGGTPSAMYSGGYPSTNSTQLATASAAASSVFTSTASTTQAQTIVIVVAQYTHSLSFFPKIMQTFLGNYLKATYVVSQLKN